MTFEEQRRVLGYTQTSLAETLGVQIKSVNNWERGKFRPGPDLCKRLIELGFCSDSVNYPMGRE